MADIMRVMPDLEGEELVYVRGLVERMSDDDAVLFANAYRSQRKDSTNVLLLTLLGFVVIAGLQRFYVGQIGMGIVYLLTAGFCFIGTIVDLIKHKSLALKYNREKAANIAATMNR